MRFVAVDSNAIHRPSAEMEGLMQLSSAGTPPSPMETSSVTPVARLRRKMLKNPLAGGDTNVVDVDAKTTNRPFPDIRGVNTFLFASAPAVLTEARIVNGTAGWPSLMLPQAGTTPAINPASARRRASLELMGVP